MKNLIVTLALFSLFASASYSQFLTGFGIKAGATFSNQDHKYKPDDFNFETKNILGFNGSVYAELLKNNFFNLVVDAGYEQRGYTSEVAKTDEFGNEIGRYNVNNKTNYITMGLLGKVKFKTKTVTPYVIIGPKVDFYLGYSINATEERSPEEISDYDPVLEQFKKINYSINLGAGLEFEKLLPFKTLVEFNYSPPINTSFNSAGLEIKEHYFNIKLGINFIKEKTKRIRK